MFSTIFMFLRMSLYPSKQVLKLRRAPLHAYMGATFFFTMLATCIDYLFLQPDFFLPMWFFLHAIAVAFFYLLWVALVALFVQVFTRVRTKKAWPYRQAWPYSVAMTLVPTSLMVVTYHLAPAFTSASVIILLFYVAYPLTQIPLNKNRVSQP